MKKIFILLLAFVLFLSYRLFVPLDWNGQIVLLDAPKGTSFYKFSENLKQKKIIRSSFDMKCLVKIFGEPPLPQGGYELSSHFSLWRIFQKLKQGKEHTFLVTFPEGFNHYEMAELLKSHDWPSAENFVKEVGNKKFVQSFLNKNFNSLEGYLFPESYRLTQSMNAKTLILAMTKKFLKVYTTLASAHTTKLSRHELVTLASIIEKETGQAKERPLIASVFYNRLKQNMKLQTDPTILYAMYLVRGFSIEKNIRKKDLLFPSAYNTYYVKGLPPGPIANPGKASLEACFSPALSDYLYFVSQNNGSHKFSKTFQEHKKAVYKYQIKAFKK